MMAKIRGICDRCGAEISIFVGQSVFDGQLLWWQSSICSNCQDAVEADDTGVPPEEVRQAILAAEGTWELILSATGKEAIAALSLLRHVLNLSLREAIALKPKIPGAIATGTRAEMEQLRQILMQVEDIEVEARQYPKP